MKCVSLVSTVITCYFFKKNLSKVFKKDLYLQHSLKSIYFSLDEIDNLQSYKGKKALAQLLMDFYFTH